MEPNRGSSSREQDKDDSNDDNKERKNESERSQEIVEQQDTTVPTSTSTPPSSGQQQEEQQQEEQQQQQQQQQQKGGYNELKKEVKRAAKDVVLEPEGGGAAPPPPSSTLLPSKSPRGADAPSLQAPLPASQEQDAVRKGQVVAAAQYAVPSKLATAAAPGETKRARTPTPPKVHLDTARSPGEVVRERTLGQRRRRQQERGDGDGDDNVEGFGPSRQSSTPQDDSLGSTDQQRRGGGGVGSRRRTGKASGKAGTNKFGVGGPPGSQRPGDSSLLVSFPTQSEGIEEEGYQDDYDNDEVEAPTSTTSIAEADATPVTDAPIQVVPVEDAPYVYTLPPAPTAEDAKRKKQKRQRRYLLGCTFILLLIGAVGTIVGLVVRNNNNPGNDTNNDKTDSPTLPPTPIQAFSPTLSPIRSGTSLIPSTVSTSAPPTLQPSSLPTRLPSLPPTFFPTLSPAPTEEPFCTICANGEPTPFPENPSPVFSNCGAWQEELILADGEIDFVCVRGQFEAVMECGCPTLPQPTCSWCGRDPRTGRDILPVNMDEEVEGTRTCREALKRTLQRGILVGIDACLQDAAKYASLCPCDESPEDAIRRLVSEVSAEEETHRLDVYDNTTLRGQVADWILADGRYSATQPEKLQQLYGLAVLAQVLDFQVGDNGTAADECTWTGVECNNDGMIISFVHNGLQAPASPFGANSQPIPEELAALRYLEVLEINRQVFFQGPLPAKTLGKLVNLRDLRFINNVDGLGGTPLPFSIFDELTQLEVVHFLNNGLTGTFPENSWRLPSLRALVCAVLFGIWRRLTTPLLVVLLLLLLLLLLAAAVVVVWFADTFWVEGNRLSGSIPKQLSRAGNLTVLALFDNGGLSGRMPNTLCALATTNVPCRLEIYVDCSSDANKTRTPITCSEECCGCENNFRRRGNTTCFF